MAHVVVTCSWVWTCPFCLELGLERVHKNYTLLSAIIAGKSHLEERHGYPLAAGRPNGNHWVEGDNAPRHILWAFNVVPESIRKVADPPGSRGDLDHTVARG